MHRLRARVARAAFICTGGFGAIAAVFLPVAVARADESTAGRYRERYRDGRHMEIGLLFHAQERALDTDHGVAVAFGAANHATYGLLTAMGRSDHVLRVLAWDSYSLSIARFSLHAGVRVSIADLMVGAGASVLSLDYIDGEFSLGMLSPVVSASLGLRLGSARLAAVGQTEFLWRWFAPNVVVRTLGLTLTTNFSQ